MSSTRGARALKLVLLNHTYAAARVPADDSSISTSAYAHAQATGTHLQQGGSTSLSARGGTAGGGAGAGGGLSDLPSWVTFAQPFVSVTRTRRDLSIICLDTFVPASVDNVDRGWRVFKLHESFDFSVSGIVHKVSAPLAAAGIPILSVSTYDTEHCLVHESRLERAVELLRASGFEVIKEDDMPDGWDVRVVQRVTAADFGHTAAAAAAAAEGGARAGGSATTTPAAALPAGGARSSVRAVPQPAALGVPTPSAAQSVPVRAARNATGGLAMSLTRGVPEIPVNLYNVNPGAPNAAGAGPTTPLMPARRVAGAQAAERRVGGGTGQHHRRRRPDVAVHDEMALLFGEADEERVQGDKYNDGVDELEDVSESELARIEERNRGPPPAVPAPLNLTPTSSGRSSGQQQRGAAAAAPGAGPTTPTRFANVLAVGSAGAGAGARRPLFMAASLPVDVPTEMQQMVMRARNLDGTPNREPFAAAASPGGAVVGSKEALKISAVPMPAGTPDAMPILADDDSAYSSSSSSPDSADEHDGSERAARAARNRERKLSARGGAGGDAAAGSASGSSSRPAGAAAAPHPVDPAALVLAEAQRHVDVSATELACSVPAKIRLQQVAAVRTIARVKPS